MTANRYIGPGMTIGNMRSHGVKSIEVTCGCGHNALVDASQLDDLTELPFLRTRMRCSACGSRPIDVRPNWREHRARGRGPSVGGCGGLPRHGAVTFQKPGSIWNQTRGTPHAGKAFSRARGRAANAKYRFGGLEGSSWAAKKWGGAPTGLE